jgi:hypothetical protein
MESQLLGSRFASGVLVAAAALGRECGSSRGPERARAARRVEAALVDLSRVFYYAAQGRASTVGEELGFAELYLRLQSLRFEERLGFRVSAAPAGAGLPLARLSLFVPLELAVAAGLESRAGPAYIAVEAEARRGGARLRVLLGRSAAGPLEIVGAARAGPPRRRKPVLDSPTRPARLIVTCASRLGSPSS